MKTVVTLTAVIVVVAGAQAGFLGLNSAPNPAQFASLGALDVSFSSISIYTGNITNAPTLTVGATVYTGQIESQSAQIDGSTYNATVGVLNFDSINIGSGVSISVSGSNALALVSGSHLTLRSNLSIGAAGASNYGNGMNTFGNQFFKAPGGAYGNDSATTSGHPRGEIFPGSSAYGEVDIASVLLGGSRGGNTWDGGSNAGGPGGGALALIADGMLNIDAVIAANGGDGLGYNSNGQSGGGSGGGILLVGREVNLDAGTDIQVLEGDGGADSENEGTGGRIALHYVDSLISDAVDAFDHLNAGNGTEYIAQIPEPSSAALMLFVGSGVWFARRTFRR